MLSPRAPHTAPSQQLLSDLGANRRICFSSMESSSSADACFPSSRLYSATSRMGDSPAWTDLRQLASPAGCAPVSQPLSQLQPRPPTLCCAMPRPELKTTYLLHCLAPWGGSASRGHQRETGRLQKEEGVPFPSASCSCQRLALLLPAAEAVHPGWQQLVPTCDCSSCLTSECGMSQSRGGQSCTFASLRTQ